MITLYAAALRFLGLSQTEAAELHQVRLDTVKSWSSGRRDVPDHAWETLRQLAAHRRAYMSRCKPIDPRGGEFVIENTAAGAYLDLGFPTPDSLVAAIAAQALGG